MTTFEEYQSVAIQTPLALRNDRDRIELPVLGLQEAAGKIGSLMTALFASGPFNPPQAQIGEVKDRLAEVLWCVACLCNETKIPIQDLAAHSVVQLQARIKDLDPDRR
jgi:hypothetical protein